MLNSLGKGKFDDNTQSFGKTNDCFGSQKSCEGLGVTQGGKNDSRRDRHYRSSRK